MVCLYQPLGLLSVSRADHRIPISELLNKGNVWEIILKMFILSLYPAMIIYVENENELIFTCNLVLCLSCSSKWRILVIEGFMSNCLQITKFAVLSYKNDITQHFRWRLVYSYFICKKPSQDIRIICWTPLTLSFISFSSMIQRSIWFARLHACLLVPLFLHLLGQLLVCRLTSQSPSQVQLVGQIVIHLFVFTSTVYC